LKASHSHSQQLRRYSPPRSESEPQMGASRQASSGTTWKNGCTRRCRSSFGLSWGSRCLLLPDIYTPIDKTSSRHVLECLLTDVLNLSHLRCRIQACVASNIETNGLPRTRNNTIKRSLLFYFAYWGKGELYFFHPSTVIYGEGRFRYCLRRRQII